jgi:hypothetical protein
MYLSQEVIFFLCEPALRPGPGVGLGLRTEVGARACLPREQHLLPGVSERAAFGRQGRRVSGKTGKRGQGAAIQRCLRFPLSSGGCGSRKASMGGQGRCRVRDKGRCRTRKSSARRTGNGLADREERNLRSRSGAARVQGEEKQPAEGSDRGELDAAVQLLHRLAVAVVRVRALAVAVVRVRALRDYTQPNLHRESSRRTAHHAQHLPLCDRGARSPGARSPREEAARTRKRERNPH